MTGHFVKGAWVEDTPAIRYSQIVGYADEDLNAGDAVYMSPDGKIHKSKPVEFPLCEICGRLIETSADDYVVTDSSGIRHRCHRGVCFETALLKYHTDPLRTDADLTCNLKIRVDDSELRDSINHLKVYLALQKKRQTLKPKAGWFLRQLRKIGIVDV